MSIRKEREMVIFNYFHVDFWTAWGLLAQALFFSSFIVQWYKSEKKGLSVLPAEFWYLRLIGSLMLFVYVFKRQDFVFFVSIILQVVIYLRNIKLLSRNEKTVK